MKADGMPSLQESESMHILLPHDGSETAMKSWHTVGRFPNFLQYGEKQGVRYAY